MISYVDLLLPRPPPPPRLRLPPHRHAPCIPLVASRLLPRARARSVPAPPLASCFYERSCSGIARLPHLVARYTGDLWRHAALSRLSSRLVCRLHGFGTSDAHDPRFHTAILARNRLSFKTRDTRYARVRDERDTSSSALRSQTSRENPFARTPVIYVRFFGYPNRVATRCRDGVSTRIRP